MNDLLPTPTASTVSPTDQPADPRARLSAQALRDDDSGATAVEFALISVPFITMLMGIMSVCIYFFTVLEVENAVWQGSRDLRVGNYQQGLGRYAGKTGDILKNEFKNSICERVRDTLDCLTNMRVQIQSYAGFGSIVAPNCRSSPGGDLITNTAANTQFDAGGASSVLLLTGCYKWKFGGELPFVKIGNMPDGSFLIQSSYTFRTEPYN